MTYGIIVADNETYNIENFSVIITIKNMLICI